MLCSHFYGQYTSKVCSSIAAWGSEEVLKSASETQEFSLAYPNLSGPWWTLLYVLSFAAFDDPSLTVFSSIFPHVTKLFQKPFLLVNRKLIRHYNNDWIIIVYMYAGVELSFQDFWARNVGMEIFQKSVRFYYICI